MKTRRGLFNNRLSKDPKYFCKKNASRIEKAGKLSRNERVWKVLQQESHIVSKEELTLKIQQEFFILEASDFESSLRRVLSAKLSDRVLSSQVIDALLTAAYSAGKELIEFAAYDLEATLEKGASTRDYVNTFLNTKGFHAIQIHRVANQLWKLGRKDLARLFQSRSAEVLNVDIHPACDIGKGIVLNHATGIVIGETAIIADNVTISQSVTLGGTGNERGDRHPKIQSNVQIGAGSTVLGNIEIGNNSKIGAGSVVLKPVYPHTTVSGIPAKVVETTPKSRPADHSHQ